MHILVSNHNAEVQAYRRALGSTAGDLKVVENNLSVLSLISTNPFDISSLVITAHQDEGINVETGTFLRNLAARAPDLWPTVVVDPVFGQGISPSVRVVDTIEEAAAMVRSIEQPVLVEAFATPTGVAHTANGNGVSHDDLVTTHTLDLPTAPASTASEVVQPAEAARTTRTYNATRNDPWLRDDEAEDDLTMRDGEPEAEIAPLVVNDAPVAVPVTQSPVASTPVAAPAPVAPAQTANAGPVVAQVPAEPPMDAFEGRNEPARSLADDIRDWTQRNEQQRGQHQPVSREKTLWQGLMDLLPANRRATAEEDALDAMIREPRLSRCQSVAIISPKGGVGKSFLTYLIGNFLAEVRGDKIVAIDTNPDFGTLADQVRGREQQTVSSLLEQLEQIKHYSDLRRYTSKVDSRLEVLAAPADPDVMATITAEDYSKVNTQLQHYYDTVLFDCGTGFRDDITRFALEQADQVVLVSAPLFITTGIVVRALGYLDQIGVPLNRVTLAINQVRRDAPLDLNYMRERFGDRLNAIVEIPFDMQLYHDLDRGEFSVERTQQPTRIRVKQLLTHMVKHFA
jgi:MinD-like ATPase involved in chromosome partitioning or flagellar assembly